LAHWLGALAIPGVGPFVAAGAFASVAGGAAVGAGLGAVAGALVGMGIPEGEARRYEDEVQRGQTLVSVQAGSRWRDEAEDVVRCFGAHEITRSGRVADPEPVPRSTLDQREERGGMFGSDSPTDGEWSAEAPRYRAAWERHSRSWDEVDPYYRYVHNLRRQPEYRDRTLDQMQPQLRHLWQERYPDRSWDRAAGTLRALCEATAERDRTTQ